MKWSRDLIAHVSMATSAPSVQSRLKDVGVVADRTANREASLFNSSLGVILATPVSRVAKVAIA